MQLVIPLHKSRINYQDLRYALRSVEKYGNFDGEVVIVGEKPAWIKNVTHLKLTDDPNEWYKERNIYRKILKSFEVVGDNFIFMNDDHVLLKDVALNV